jgi:hypothetical protein
MRRQENPLKEFLEPGNTPILFIVGSMFLAVLGEGFYGLLEDMFGDSWLTRLFVVSVALLVFGTVTFVFWLRARQLHHQEPPEPTGEKAEPHAGLVLLASMTPNSAEPDILAHHRQGNTLQHCWIIVSPQVKEKAVELATKLEQQGVDAHTEDLADVNRIDQAYTAVQNAIRQARRVLKANEQVIVDITGSTKVATAGAVLACMDEGVTMEYMVTERDAAGKPIGKATAMKVEFQPHMRSPGDERSSKENGEAEHVPAPSAPASLPAAAPPSTTPNTPPPATPQPAADEEKREQESANGDTC